MTIEDELKKPGTLAQIKITNHFEDAEAAAAFAKKYGTGPGYGIPVVGPPDHGDDEALMLDEHKRNCIVQKVLQKH